MNTHVFDPAPDQSARQNMKAVSNGRRGETDKAVALCRFSETKREVHPRFQVITKRGLNSVTDDNAQPKIVRKTTHRQELGGAALLAQLKLDTADAQRSGAANIRFRPNRLVEQDRNRRGVCKPRAQIPRIHGKRL